MKVPIRLYVAQSNFLMTEGLKSVFDSNAEVELVGVALNPDQMHQSIVKAHPDVLLIDYASTGFCAGDVSHLMRSMPAMKVIGITHQCEVDTVKQLLKSGLNGHLMSDCDMEEIVDSVTYSARGEKFFCGKVLDRLNAAEGNETDHGCDPVNISERELEILQLVAQGLTTKQIAEKLHLSFHTVMTHRKNMMNKLGINNTAGLIIYAVRENLISPNRFLFSDS